MYIALTAHLSTASPVQKDTAPLKRRQTQPADNNGAAQSNLLGDIVGGLLGGSGTVGGMLSGYSIASTFVTAMILWLQQ